MITITLTIFWLALIDSMNPTIIAITIALILYKNTWGVWGFIHGVFLTTLFQLLLLYLGLSRLLNITSNKNSHNVHWFLILIGLGMLLYGWYLWQHRYHVPTVHTLKNFSSFNYTNYLKFILLGSVTTWAEAPTAFLLILAVVELKKLQIDPIFTLLYFILYALIYTLPIIALNITAIWQEKRLKIWLSKRLNWLYIRLNIVISLSVLALGIFCLAIGVGQLSK